MSDTTAREIESARRRALVGVNALRGIPAFMAQWSTFQGVVECCDRALESLESELSVLRGESGNKDSEWCLRTDGASAPLPCCYTKGHKGPCYFRW